MKKDNKTKQKTKLGNRAKNRKKSNRLATASNITDNTVKLISICSTNCNMHYRHNTSSLVCRWWRRHTIVCTSGLRATAAGVWQWSGLERISLQSGAWDACSLPHSWSSVSSVIIGSSRITTARQQQRGGGRDDDLRIGPRGNCTSRRRCSSEPRSAPSQDVSQISAKHQ